MVKVVLRRKNAYRGDQHDRRSHPTAGALRRRRSPEDQAPDEEELRRTESPKEVTTGHKRRALKPGTSVEVCYGLNSRLSAAADSLRNSGAFRVTEEMDFLNPQTLQECINRVRGPDDMAWF